MTEPLNANATRPRARRLSNPAAVRERNYPKNQWWVAALSSQLHAKPLQRWLLGMPVVLYRRGNGEPVALDDRCPHRWAPLSTGHVNGDDIVCGYHGMQFGSDGLCTRVPTQAMTPAARVRCYPVIERGPFLWVWTGDLQAVERADLPPELDWTTDASRVTASGAMEVACNYMAIKENVLDLSHFGYVHAHTLAVTDWISPPDVRRAEGSVSYDQAVTGRPLPAHYGTPTGIGCERPVDRRSWGTYVSPALQTAGVDIEDLAATGRQRFELRICHATTPIDLGRTSYWWFFSQDYGHGEGAAAKLSERIEAAFLEDKSILEATEDLVRRDPRGCDYPQVSVLCDQAGIEARRLLLRSLQREADSLPDV